MQRLIEPELRAIRQQVHDMGRQVVGLVAVLHDGLQETTFSTGEMKQRSKRLQKADLRVQRHAVRALTLHQPVADDFREVYALLKISATLEQLGCTLRSIGNKMCRLQHRPTDQVRHTLQLDTVQQHAEAALRDALEYAFNPQAAVGLADVQTHDRAVRKANDQLFQHTVTLIQDAPQHTEDYIKLLRILKQYQKLADRALFIAEEGYFLREGLLVRHRKLKSPA